MWFIYKPLIGNIPYITILGYGYYPLTKWDAPLSSHTIWMNSPKWPQVSSSFRSVNYCNPARDNFHYGFIQVLVKSIGNPSENHGSHFIQLLFVVSNPKK